MCNYNLSTKPEEVKYLLKCLKVVGLGHSLSFKSSPGSAEIITQWIRACFLFLPLQTLLRQTYFLKSVQLGRVTRTAGT